MIERSGPFVHVTGVVTTGRGNSARSLVDRIGPLASESGVPAGALELGTLNLVLDDTIFFDPQTSLWREHGTKFRVFPGQLNGQEVFILRWRRCRSHVLEIASHINLRRELGLRDGDRVTVITERTSLSKPRGVWWHRFWFFLIWKGRKHLYYTSKTYPKLVGPVELLTRVLQK